MTSTIPRLKLADLQQEFNEQHTQLMQEATTKLGYRVNHPLLTQLTKLGITPFRTSSVERYMNDREHTTIYSGTRDWLVWVVATLIIGASSIWVIVHYSGWKSSVGTGFVVISAFSLLGSLFLCDEVVGCGTRTRWSWDSVPISSFAELIPDHVLTKAISIKETIPNCELRISSLVSSTEERHPDPFLSVSLGKEKYYVEQWDEQDLPQLDI
jgi:hypothetical protein